MKCLRCLVLSLTLLLLTSHALPAALAFEPEADRDEEFAFIGPRIFYGPVLPPKETLTEPEPPAVPPGIQYRMASGDTLYKIARAFNVTVDDLTAHNQIDNPNQLAIGTLLHIPPLHTALELPEGHTGVIRQVLSATLTAYTAGVESTGKQPGHPDYGITFSGSSAAEGRTIAVDPSLIPIGSTVLIEGVGIRRAEDTGSAIRGPRIDVFMNDLQEARQFGVKRNVKVYVLAVNA